MTDAHIAASIERAFEYRGFVTITRRDGTRTVGFLYDRGPDHVEMLDESAALRISVAVADIADVSLSGDDAAAEAQHRWDRRRGKLEVRGTSAWGDWEERPTLILTALPIEVRGVARALHARIRGGAVRGDLGDQRVIARAIGMGGGAAHVIEAERPRLVISCGFAGGLVPSLRTGSIVLASAVTDESGERVTAGAEALRLARTALEEHGRVEQGELLCATSVAATPDEKAALARPGRLAVDLESWGAARACERAGVPWLALRVVIDPLDAALPAFTREIRARYVGAALRHLLGGPRSALELARTALRADTASRALEQAIRHLAPALGRIAGGHRP
jgi:adenosylhomocysteine nucleosidase